MKNFRKIFLILASLSVFISCLAFADTAPIDVTPVSTDEFLHFLFASLGGLKGASALVIAAFVVQALILLFKTSILNSFFLRIGGQWKITILTALTLISGVVGLRLSGVPLAAALIHSTTLSAFLVFSNQVYRQFTDRSPTKLGPDDPNFPTSPMTTVHTDPSGSVTANGAAVVANPMIPTPTPATDPAGPLSEAPAKA